MSDDDLWPKCNICGAPAVMSYGWIGQQGAPWYCNDHSHIAYEAMVADGGAPPIPRRRWWQVWR
jgi:hypothetical protein